MVGRGLADAIIADMWKIAKWAFLAGLLIGWGTATLFVLYLNR